MGSKNVLAGDGFVSVFIQVDSTSKKRGFQIFLITSENTTCTVHTVQEEAGAFIVSD